MKSLANGWRACLIQLAGDFDYYSKWFDAAKMEQPQRTMLPFAKLPIEDAYLGPR